MTADSRKTDFQQKLTLLRGWLTEQKMDGLLLTTTVNWGWLTHGRAHVNIADSRSVAKVLITEKNVEIFTGSNEAPRLSAEEVAGLDVRIRERFWFETFESQWTGAGMEGLRIAVDTDVDEQLSRFRLVLSENEVALLRSLGAQSAKVLENCCRGIRPGMTEFEVSGKIAAAAWAEGIEPLVLNVAADERALRFRHGIPTGNRLQKYAVISVCFRKWGLHVTLTRTVSFGKVSEELGRKHGVACELEALAQGLTRPGADTDGILGELLEAYRRSGFGDEWKKHPVGGATGFQPREYDVAVGDFHILQKDQAFCWNPTIMGTKSEDTVILTDSGCEPVTTGDGFPLMTAKAGGRELFRPGILEL